MKHFFKPILCIALLAMLFSCATTEKPEGFSRFRLTSFTVYDGDENPIQQVNLAYNEWDKPAAIIMKDGEGNEEGQRVISYNDRGDIISIETSGAYTAYTLSLYSYDESGYLTSIVTSDREGNILNRADYVNDSEGNPVEWTSGTGNASQDVHFLLEYDEEGRIVKTTELDPSGEPIYYSRSTYDEQGNELSYIIHSPEGMIDQQLANTYREGTLVQSDILDEKGNLLYRTVKELNEKLQPVLISNYNQYGDRSDYSTITYDEEGREIETASYNYEEILIEKTEKEYDQWGNNTALILKGTDGAVYSLTRNTYEEKPLRMEEKEFNSLVFRLR